MSATITAEVDRPTQALMQQGIAIVSGAFAQTPPGLVPTGAEVQLKAADCTAIIRKAESQAIAQARQNAAFLAGQLGAHEGRVLALTESGTSPNPGGDCTSTYYVGPFTNPQGLSGGDMAETRVFSTVVIRFEIRR